MSAINSISPPTQEKETKQHLLSLPDKTGTGRDFKKSQNNIDMEISNQISAIAKIIRQDWKKVYFGAVPYLSAMGNIVSIQEMYFEDSAKSILRYFLSNAGTWRGATAKAVKTKLNQLLND